MQKHAFGILWAALLCATSSTAVAEDFLVAGKKFKNAAEAEAHARTLMEQWLLSINSSILEVAETPKIGGSVIALIPSDDFIKKNYLFVAQDKRLLSRRNPTQAQIDAFANSVQDNIRLGYRAIERTGYFTSVQIVELPAGQNDPEVGIYKADYVLYQLADQNVPQNDRGIFTENRKVYTGYQTRTTKFMVRDVSSGRDLNYTTMVGLPAITRLAPVDLLRLINFQLRKSGQR